MPHQAPSLEVGSVVAGYHIDSVLSHGGMAVLYRVTSASLGRQYILKVISPELVDDEQARRRFEREIRIAAALRHPNIVRVHYAGEHEGAPFLVMDLIEGDDLRGIVLRDGRLEAERAGRLLTQVASALDAAHRHGLVHRDVKPGNVLVAEEDGEEWAYLTDFGLAKRIDSPTDITVVGSFLGTVSYTPPEQIKGLRLDARSDVYSLACVFFEALTGRVPFERPDTAATLWAHVHDPRPSIRAARSDLPTVLDAVFAQAMDPDPDRRHASAGDFARDFQAGLRGVRYEGAPRAIATGDAAPLPGEAPEEAPDAIRVLPLGGRTGQAERPPGESGWAEAASQDDLAMPVTSEPGAGESIAASRQEEAATQSSAEAARRRSSAASAAGPPAPAPGAGRAARLHQGRGVADGDVERRKRNRRRAIAALVALIVVAGIVALILALSGSGGGGGIRTELAPVPTNRVKAVGEATVKLDGDLANVTVTTTGLLNGVAHLMHIHAGGLGLCPPGSAATVHNGHRAMSTDDGARFYGPPVAALTTTGDTSSKSTLAFDRFPRDGDIKYKRSIPLGAITAARIRDNNAVVVVHGIDYNRNRRYDNAIGVSDLTPTLPGEATAPALCGVLKASPARAATEVSTGRALSRPVYAASLVSKGPPVRLAWFAPRPASP